MTPKKTNFEDLFRQADAPGDDDQTVTAPPPAAVGAGPEDAEPAAQPDPEPELINSRGEAAQARPGRSDGRTGGTRSGAGSVPRQRAPKKRDIEVETTTPETERLTESWAGALNRSALKLRAAYDRVDLVTSQWETDVANARVAAMQNGIPVRDIERAITMAALGADVDIPERVNGSRS